MGAAVRPAVAPRDAASAAATPAPLGTAQVLARAAELSEAGAHAEALFLLDRALEADPAAAALHAARGWALENLGAEHLPQARAAYQAAIGLDPEDLWARLGLATVLEQLGCIDGATSRYRELLADAPARAAREPELFELLGWCQYRLGQFDAAAATFERALAIDNTWVSVRFDLGLVKLLRADAAGAFEQYRHGLHTLASRGADRRAGPLQVALEDLEAALQARPLLAASPAAGRIRAALVEAAREAAAHRDD